VRYLGNKARLVDKIEIFLKENNVTGSVFCDLFSGTGTVSDYFKDRYRIIANDFMTYAKILTLAKLKNENVPEFINFNKKYKTNPFDYFNNKYYILKENSFVAKTYTPLADRRFLTTENGIKIDGIRQDIENFYMLEILKENEYFFLLASLVESVTKFSNTSGTYEAFLKKWDPRSLKDFIITPLEMRHTKINTNNTVFSNDSNQLIREITGDILYIDPPYTVTEYSSAYHLLETVVRYDFPEVAGITARRQKERKLSNYTRKLALDTFEDLIRQAEFKHIIISYSNESIISIDDLVLMLKKYAINNYISIKRIPSRVYKNLRESMKSDRLEEVLIYFEKDNEIIKSPLNYSGSKYYIIRDIIRILPGRITDFVDVMGGAFNVGSNIVANRVIYNEYNTYVFELIKYLFESCKEDIITDIERTIEYYGLDNSSKEEYLKLRADYNKSKKINDLYTLTLFCFQNQIRFNNNHEFNTPVGNCGYNTNIRNRINVFSSKTKNVEFTNFDFSDYPYHLHDKDTVFYFDPPYMITNATYNDGN
jgi:adenine-specific DNA-methyltransferase